MDLMKSTLLTITKWNTSHDNEWGYTPGALPFIDYILEDKSKYPKLSSVINPKLNSNWIDKDDDFLFGKSGGVLMNMNFVFIGTEIFSRTAQYYDRHGVYINKQEGTEEYKRFWKSEMKRRLRGVQANCKLLYTDIEAYYNAETEEERKALLKPLRITGDHYNYLNFSRIERAPNPDERAKLDAEGRFKVKTVEGFPRFWDGDYWNFKVDELIALNIYNLAKAKARRKGFSYKRGSQAANTLNANKNVTVALVADDIGFLTDKGATSYMVKVNLDWYETQTDWYRGYLSEDFNKGIELGYKRKSEGNKAFGFRSKLLSFANGRNESNGIGTKALEMDFEEAGKMPNLQNSLNVLLSNAESGGTQIGTYRVYGTAGTRDSNWAAFSRVFYEPDLNDMLHFENIYDDNSRHKTCGYFHPQIWCYEPYIEDGNSLIFAAWKHDKARKDNAKNKLKGQDYTVFVGQRANKPSEAFVNTRDNMFISPDLVAYENYLKTDNESKYYKDGWYIMNEDKQVEFIERNECIERDIFRNGKQFHDYIEDIPFNNKTDIHGCVREYFPPIPNSGDLYLVTYDTYAVDKNKEDITNKHSLGGIQVWTRENKLYPAMGKRLVAEYTGRLNRVEDCDKLYLYFLLRYNGKGLPEINRGDVVKNFKQWGYRHLLLNSPLDAVNENDRTIRMQTKGIVIGGGTTKLEGLELLYDFLYELIGRDDDGNPIWRFQTIPSWAYIKELLEFDAVGNWDRISASLPAMFQFRADDYKMRKDIDGKAQRTAGKADRQSDGRPKRLIDKIF